MYDLTGTARRYYTLSSCVGLHVDSEQAYTAIDERLSHTTQVTAMTS